jgi:hypothetical protein
VSNYSEREELWQLIISAIDSLERMVKARELTNIIWDLNITMSKTERDWIRTELLLESYEKIRDESLEGALLNLRDLIQIMSEETDRN